MTVKLERAIIQRKRQQAYVVTLVQSATLAMIVATIDAPEDVPAAFLRELSSDGFTVGHWRR